MNSPIFPTIALLAAAGIFFAYVGPTWAGPIKTAQATIEADDQALVAAQRYSAQQDQLAAARDSIDQEGLAALTALLPDSVDNVGLILDLNALAARSGFSITSINVAKAAPNLTVETAGGLSGPGMNAIGSVDLSLAGIGAISALQEFLKGVEQSRRLLDVRDIIVKGSNTGVYDYQMVIRLYWLR